MKYESNNILQFDLFEFCKQFHNLDVDGLLLITTDTEADNESFKGVSTEDKTQDISDNYNNQPDSMCV